MDLRVPLLRLGWPDQFIEQGKPDALRAKYGLSADAALELARPHLARLARQQLVAGR